MLVRLMYDDECYLADHTDVQTLVNRLTNGEEPPMTKREQLSVLPLDVVDKIAEYMDLNAEPEEWAPGTLSDGFSWDKTEEGWGYWTEVCEQLKAHDKLQCMQKRYEIFGDDSIARIRKRLVQDLADLESILETI